MNKLSMRRSGALWLLPLGLSSMSGALYADAGEIIVLREVPARTATRAGEPGRTVAVETSPRTQIVSSLGISTDRDNLIARELGDGDFASLVTGHQALTDAERQQGMLTTGAALLGAMPQSGQRVGGVAGVAGASGAAAGRAVTGAMLRLIVMMKAAKQ